MRSTKALLLAAFVGIAMSGAVLAGDHEHDNDRPGPDWMPKADLITKMQGEGYSSIVVEADDGEWEGLAVKNGAIVKFHADPRSGDITKVKPKEED